MDGGDEKRHLDIGHRLLFVRVQVVLYLRALCVLVSLEMSPALNYKSQESLDYLNRRP